MKDMAKAVFNILILALRGEQDRIGACFPDGLNIIHRIEGIARISYGDPVQHFAGWIHIDSDVSHG